MLISPDGRLSTPNRSVDPSESRRSMLQKQTLYATARRWRVNAIPVFGGAAAFSKLKSNARAPREIIRMQDCASCIGGRFAIKQHCNDRQLSL